MSTLTSLVLSGKRRIAKKTTIPVKPEANNSGVSMQSQQNSTVAVSRAGIPSEKEAKQQD